MHSQIFYLDLCQDSWQFFGHCELQKYLQKTVENTKGYERPSILFSSRKHQRRLYSSCKPCTIPSDPCKKFGQHIQHELHLLAGISWATVSLQCVCGASPVSLLCGNLFLWLFLNLPKSFCCLLFLCCQQVEYTGSMQPVTLLCLLEQDSFLAIFLLCVSVWD